MKNESALLVLRTCDADVAQDTYKQFLLFDIDFRNLLGEEMYNKYSQFSMSLASAAHDDSGTFADDESRLVNVALSGIPFLRCTTRKRTVTTTALAGILHFKDAESQVFSFAGGGNRVTFYKAAQIQRLAVTFPLVSTGLPSGADTFPNLQLVFDIRGVV